MPGASLAKDDQAVGSSRTSARPTHQALSCGSLYSSSMLSCRPGGDIDRCERTNSYVKGGSAGRWPPCGAAHSMGRSMGRSMGHLNLGGTTEHTVDDSPE